MHDLCLNKSEQVKSTSYSSETWRSDTLVRTLILFWIEGYSMTANDNGSPNNSPAGGAGGVSVTHQSSSSVEYFSASLKVASSLPSAELIRVVRMFIKHSHYFANACQQGSVYVPASLKVDVFSSRANKALLFSFLAQAIGNIQLKNQFMTVFWCYNFPFIFELKLIFPHRSLALRRILSTCIGNMAELHSALAIFEHNG